MKIETLQVAGFEPAFMGMRNPLNSWDRSDSVLHDDKVLLIGEKDMHLAKSLIRSGSEHAKFLRQIQVWADVTMPRYFWSEADTYSFGSKNSCSTMHKLFDPTHKISIEDFEFTEDSVAYLMVVVGWLNSFRDSYIESNDTEERRLILRKAKQILPEAYLQKRTWNTNYAELRNMYHQRKHHRLKEEWQDVFCRWVESLPYANELIVG